MMHNQCNARDNRIASTFCGLFVGDAEVGNRVSRHVCSIDHHAQGLFEVDRPLNPVMVCGAIYGNLQRKLYILFCFPLNFISNTK
jgi:hypothetical protein